MGPDVLWQTDLSDARAGYLLERWLPAPVGLHDTFGIALDVAVVDSAVAYALVSNGRVAATGEARWHVTWPSDSDVMSPLVDLVARSKLWSLSDGIGGVDLHYEDRMIGLMAGFREGGPEAWLASTDDLVTGFTARFGPRRWGDAPYQLVLQPLQTAAGMEYPNAATIVDLRGDILAHEVAHAWFGRTLVPARHIDAWFDEAMAMWLTTTPAYGFDGYLPVDPWSSEATPVAHADPWTRQTFITAYRLGPRIVETLFERFGKDAFDGVWRDLIRDCSGRHLTHHDLRRAFRALGDADFVDALFERWVIAPGDAEVLGTCLAIGGAP
ncbi:MAG: hypothetical protein U1F43_08140 [Myxococcota bacterium]